MYEGGTREPLIVKWPGKVAPGSTCTTSITSPDFYPTLLEIAGLPLQPEQHCDGVSLLPLLHQENASDRPAIFWHYPHYWNGGKVSPYSVARMGDWKLIRFYEDGREELYDLARDLSEARDLAGSNPDKRREISARLDAWLKEVGAQMPVPKNVAGSSRPGAN